MKMRTSALLALPVLAGSLLLAGCTVTGPTESFSGLPDEEHITQESEGGDDGLQAFWLEEGDSIAIAISGSSTCPVVGSRIRVVEPKGEGNTVAIDTVPLPDQPCTMDFVPHTSVFWTPSKVTPAEPLTIQVDGREIVLPVK
ncbi:hypothetical protein N1027_09270 [Herbiconiux sp. CPCC 205763]|uniref:Lipoprotein n=1 Tax=Herbiconiux aconitum TaxID=2970913 RepID=A0ABT2GQ27_9MICO|nr:hypothetical protein [Herbiconiux aconitum]MCS5718329.1 hypothetical protein [Herbiconiux aconitum]